jgi:glycine/D-amino acid oxidase-like deaminating enzyme
MDERAAIPVTLPRPRPTVSYWQDPPDADIADYISEQNVPETADIVIVGSGITGTSIAYGLLKDQAAGKIVMVEARQACSGATGRNGIESPCSTSSILTCILPGGHTKAASYRSFLDNAASLGTAQAVKIAQFEYQTIESLHAFSREHNIGCDLFSGDTVDIIYDRVQWDQCLTSVEAMRKAMPHDLDGAAKYTFWSPEQAREKFFVKGDICFGAVSYKAGSLSAYKFVIGLLKMCLKKGLELYTNSPVVKLEKLENGAWDVETNRGLIRAKKVIMATNGYTGFLCKKFHKVIVPLRGQVTAHMPGKNMPTERLVTTYSFIYGNGYEYMIPRPKGSRFEADIVIGGGLVKAKDEGIEEFGTTDDTSLNSEVSDYLTETTPRYFGESWGEDHEDGRIRKEWTGIMGYSSDGFPFIGEVPGEKDLWIAASFQGHGMVLCFLCAKALVAMMSGNNAEIEPWFPDIFRVTSSRMQKRFLGRLHTKPKDILTETDLETGS